VTPMIGVAPMTMAQVRPLLFSVPSKPIYFLERLAAYFAVARKLVLNADESDCKHTDLQATTYAIHCLDLFALRFHDIITKLFQFHVSEGGLATHQDRA